ncbi:MAG: DNA internalization-related competence protein ComEC/Rec2 [Gemmatimonadetes bacterium]|nr:DNA internalization-related competence protein ComEC/Rec2 [Gemmatimonadota bacterium]
MGTPVVWFAVAYTAGMAAALVVAVPPVASLCVTAVLLVVGGKTLAWRHRLLCALLVGATVGSVTRRRAAEGCAERWAKGEHAAYVRIHDAPGRRGTATATVVHAPEGCRGRVRLRFTTAILPASGETVVVVGSVHSPGWMRVRHLRHVSGYGIPLRFRVRERIARRIHRLYGARAGLVDAIVLGRREDLDPELRALFTSAGLAHLLAISGLHVGIVAAWTRVVARAVLGSRVSWPISATVTWVYVALLGFPAAATRAAAFVTIYAVGRSRQRRPPPSAVLAVAALVVWTFDPGAVSSIGAWLSIAAVAGTVWAAGLSRSRHAGLTRLFAVSCGATLATAPITALAFGSVAPIGMLSNLFAVPLAGIAVPAIFASIAFGSTLAVSAGLVLSAIERIAVVASKIPWGHLNGEPGWSFALPWLLVLGAAVWTTWRAPKWVVARYRAAAALAAVCWGLVAMPHIGGRSDDGKLAIYILSVGQGDAIAVRTPRGRWMLIDAGPRFRDADAGRRVVMPFFRRRGVQRLDVVLVSHGDADHLGGLVTVIEHTRPELVLEPAQPLGTALYGEYLGVVDAFAGDWRAARAGDTLEIDSVVVAVLHPSARWISRESSPNENSLILHLRFKEFDALFTGDAGFPAESEVHPRLSAVELLKVGHHGSAGSTSAPFLDAIRPRVAVISVGRNNRFGHPAPAVMRRLAARGIVVYRTDEGGTVTIRTDGSYFEIDQGKSPHLAERVRCAFLTWLPSNGSSWSRNVCTRRQPGSSRAFSMTSR